VESYARSERFPIQNPNRRNTIPIAAATQNPGCVKNVRENSLGARMAVHSGIPTKRQANTTKKNLMYALL
jgi:hypothetical protein